MFRTEYPRPQFVRGDWINLNGTWEYQTDKGGSGVDRKLYLADAVFGEKITVPFCRESELSGIGDKDFCSDVWYRKKVSIPADWAGKRVLLHIGACDYLTTVWVNGKEVGHHIGGSVTFSFDITPYLENGEGVITIHANDERRSGKQPGGKQSDRYESYACFYTRTTGIWQTVWLEAVEPSHIVSVKYYPDINAKTLTVHAKTANADGMTLSAAASYKGTPMGAASATVYANAAVLTLKLDELHLWELGNGRLYDLELTLGDDGVKSYFGMRNVGLKNGIMYLNGKPVFQRLVLDQGFYPDGIWTAPSDEALIRDIEYSMAMGFNGARLHQKVFEQRFLYHCDRLGYMVWGEFGNWGCDIARIDAWKTFIPEWMEIVERDFCNPAIIGWCPLNETQKDQDNDFVRTVAFVTRVADPTRLYIDASGWTHVPGVTDILDSHDYKQNVEEFTQRINENPSTFVSEYGGIRWDAGASAGNYIANTVWGYGDAPKTGEEYIARFKGLTEAILFNPKIGGLCYTQLTDVEQEQNGLYTYDRRAKFDPAVFHAVLTQKAAVEE